MAYSSFRKITMVTERFGLQLDSAVLFPSVKKIKPSRQLLTQLEIGDALGFSSEKERSERLVAPVLAEITLKNKVVLYSGRDLEADEESGLVGECDYLWSLNSRIIDEVISPIFSVVEAKKQDIEYGTAQCAAQLYGARVFNEKHGKPLNKYYGCSTSGVEWRFLKFENNVITLDMHRYTLGELSSLLGILQSIIDECKSEVDTPSVFS